MRPPEFTGGNYMAAVEHLRAQGASMRPPEFTGGNQGRAWSAGGTPRRFNEAAGIHRRKLRVRGRDDHERAARFNEAAGIHRRKRPACNSGSATMSLLQ